VILLDESRTGLADGSVLAAVPIRELAEGAWREDVTSHPVDIRLAGVLDDSTGTNLFNVVAECVAQGQRDFHLDTSALRLDGAGWQVVERIRRHVHGAGGRVHWDREALS
jgi:hypothetical protein